MKSENFALIGAGGYIAPRHMRAIKATGSGKTALLSLSAVIGLVGGGILVLFVEFYCNVRRRLQLMSGQAELCNTKRKSALTL